MSFKCQTIECRSRSRSTAFRVALCFLAALSIVEFASGQDQRTYEAEVTKVMKGDLIQIRYQGLLSRVFLAEIDAPEKRQAWYRESRKALARKIAGKVVTVEGVDRDRAGRLIARIWLDGRDINSEMVAEGHAWASRKRPRSAALIESQRQAKKAQLGLWSQPDPVAPWTWRTWQKKRTY